LRDFVQPEAGWPRPASPSPFQGEGLGVRGCHSVERDNPNLKNKLPRDYARRGIDSVKMKGLIDLIANIGFKGTYKQARDTLGRVYEHFLGKFAQAEGMLGGDIQQRR
jgi:type I restriction enzyme M protein